MTDREWGALSEALFVWRNRLCLRRARELRPFTANEYTRLAERHRAIIEAP